MDNGFIKLHRSLLNWEWYKDSNTKALFLHLLLNANWKDGNYKGYKIKIGSLPTGRKQLAHDLGLTERQVRTALQHLATTNEIVIQTTNKFSIISLVNWDKYQISENETDQQSANKRPTNDHTIRNKENKELCSNDCKKIFALYREICNPTLTPLKKETSKRCKAIEKILKAYSVDEVEDVFRKVASNPFYQGNNDYKWKANFDYILKEEKFIQLLENTQQDKTLEDEEREIIEML